MIKNIYKYSLPISLVLIIFLIIYSKGAQLAHDPFRNNDDLRLQLLSGLESYDYAAIKYKHASNSDIYDIGFFGNSTIIELSAIHLNNSRNKKIFNFAIPGNSFRQSVEIIKKLNTDSKLPKVIIISLDNFSTSFSTQPNFPNFLFRSTTIIKNIYKLFNNKEYILSLKLFHDLFLYEIRNISNLFRTEIIYSRLSYWLPNVFQPIREFNIPHNTDGSRKIVNNKPTKSWNYFVKPRPHFWNYLLKEDLNYLSQIDPKKTSILIYESPIHPNITLKGRTERLEQIINDRKKFFNSCSNLNIKCIDSPIIKNKKDWVDPIHPPAKNIGQFIDKILEQHDKLN